MSRKLHGWYCPKCDAIYFNPDADSEHEEFHESVNVEVEEW